LLKLEKGFFKIKQFALCYPQGYPLTSQVKFYDS